MSKNFFSICIAISIVLLFTSCVKTNTNVSTKDNKGIFEVSIEGDINPQFHVEGGCDVVHAFYYPQSATYEYYHSLMIQGLDNKQLITIFLYFKEFPVNSSFNLDPASHGGNAFGVMNFVPDINNSASDFSSDENNIGTCTITEYDQINQTVSGTFSCTTQGYNNGATLAGIHASFSGTFTNVPINDLTDPDNPKGPCYGTTGSNLGSTSETGTGSGSQSSITYKNDTFTPVDITVNSSSKTISPGSTTSFSGEPNAAASGSANTSGKTSQGTQVGLLMSWGFNDNFPASGNKIVNLDIAGQYFFLRIKNNNATTSFNKLYVNYGLVDQTVDNISIPNDGNLYNIGYYKAYSNSNVRAENGNLYWFWSSLNLPFSQNQSISIVAN
jgi:hypothetical protein